MASRDWPLARGKKDLEHGAKGGCCLYFERNFNCLKAIKMVFTHTALFIQGCFQFVISPVSTVRNKHHVPYV